MHELTRFKCIYWCFDL